MNTNNFTKYIGFVLALTLTGCAGYEPGLRSQDLTRSRLPTVSKVQEGLEVSVEEFVTPGKSRQAFDADIASYGILALLVRVENGGTGSYGVQRNHITALLGGQHLPQLTGEQAARLGANREYVGKALGWTLATGPFAILLWPATVAGSASHTRSVNRRIEQHFESLSFTDALVKPNQVAAGFAYFKLPDGIEKLKNLIVEVEVSKNQGADKIISKLSLPPLELSAPVSTSGPVKAEETGKERE